MADTLEGKVSADVCGAVANAGGKMLKMVEMEYRYGVRQVGEAPGRRTLVLIPD